MHRDAEGSRAEGPGRPVGDPGRPDGASGRTGGDERGGGGQGTDGADERGRPGEVSTDRGTAGRRSADRRRLLTVAASAAPDRDHGRSGRVCDATSTRSKSASGQCCSVPGRKRAEDRVDHAVGVIVRAQVGERVEPGDAIWKCTTATNGRSGRRCPCCARRSAWEMCAGGWEADTGDGRSRKSSFSVRAGGTNAKRPVGITATSRPARLPTSRPRVRSRHLRNLVPVLRPRMTLSDRRHQ